MPRSGHRPRPPLTDRSPCPCGLPARYSACCGRLHQGQAVAATAEQLMRSRYSAYFAGQRAYLLTTWHPAGRPARLDLDPALRWLGLEILATTGGSPFHTEGTVTFRARGARGTTPYILEEHSRFVRYQGAWVYLDALPTP